MDHVSELNVGDLGLQSPKFSWCYRPI